MSKVIEWRVACPECSHLQTYHSHNKQVKNTRTKECERCGHQFKAKTRRVKNLPAIQRRLEKEKKEKGTGFHKYSKKQG